LYEKSFARVAPALAAAVPDVEPVLMRADGSLSVDGASPVVAWANSDVYDGGPVRDFMLFCLKSPSLRFVQSSAAGFDHPIFGKLVDRGIALANSPASAIGIAEFVFANVLDICHDLSERRRAQSARQWQAQTFRELHGMRWLVIGMGNIGREVAVRARAFGAHVTGVRRSIAGDEPVERMLTPSQLLPELGGADVVVVCAPANAETERMVDARFLSQLRPASILVNVARGALVDETALLAALERGVPAWAVLDVFQTEPLPVESPFWSHPRVRLSAHDAANGSGFIARNDALFIENLARFARGALPCHLVAADRIKPVSAHGA
jgi:phosphoglycerate dehydrogenase-like enzyme